MTVAVAAETRISHSVARVCAAPTAAPTSLSRQVRDSGGVPFCLARPGMRGSVPFGPARHRCSVISGVAQCARRSSVLPGAARVAFFHSAWRGMHGVLPFRPGRHARQCSDLSGTARYAWQCSVLPGAAYTAVFCSARRGIGVSFCLVWPGVRDGPPFYPTWHTWPSSVLLCTVCAAFFRCARGGMHAGLPFRQVRHTRRCSVLSGAARYARRCSVLPGAAYVVVFRSAQRGICGDVPFCPAQPSVRGGVARPL